MFGKLSSLISYWKVLEVYTLKRFPSNKLPVFGMVFTYFTLYYTLHKQIRDGRTSTLKHKREELESRSLSQWTFNTNNKC